MGNEICSINYICGNSINANSRSHNVTVDNNQRIVKNPCSDGMCNEFAQTTGNAMLKFTTRGMKDTQSLNGVNNAYGVMQKIPEISGANGGGNTGRYSSNGEFFMNLDKVIKIQMAVKRFLKRKRLQRKRKSYHKERSAKGNDNGDNMSEIKETMVMNVNGCEESTKRCGKIDECVDNNNGNENTTHNITHTQDNATTTIHNDTPTNTTEQHAVNPSNSAIKNVPTRTRKESITFEDNPKQPFPTTHPTLKTSNKNIPSAYDSICFHDEENLITRPSILRISTNKSHLQIIDENQSLNLQDAVLSHNFRHNNYLNLKLKKPQQQPIASTPSKGISLIDYYSNSIMLRNSEILHQTEIKGYFLQIQEQYTYQGATKNNAKHGYGKITWKDTSNLHAKFNLNRANGICKFYSHKYTSLFEGYYINNRPNGYGQLTKKYVSYKGLWINNDLCGPGLEMWKDDTYYQGDFVKSERKGIGLYRWPDGTIYQGEWDRNQMNGMGIITYSDERMYMGEFKEGAFNGFGQFYWGNEKMYIGTYKNNKKNGFGMFISSKEPLKGVVALWENGKADGPGVQIVDDKVQFAVFKNNKIDVFVDGGWSMVQFLNGSTMKYGKFFRMGEKNILNFVKKYTLL